MSKPIGWYVTQHEPNKWCHPSGATVVLSEDGTTLVAVRADGSPRVFSIKECGGQAKCEKAARDWAVRTHHRKNPAAAVVAAMRIKRKNPTARPAPKKAARKNPPKWVPKADAAKWRRAEELVKAEYGTVQGKYGVVTHIYKALGGKVGAAKKARRSK